MYIDRRDFIKSMSATYLAAMGASLPRMAAASEALVHPKATADTCILVWLAGGVAAPDTFDPKPYLPFEIGTEIKRIGSTFPAIDTVVDNIKITEGLENMARVMDRGTLIRSHVQPDLGHILHSRHQYHWHTGYVPPITVAAPHMGSWIAKVLGPRNPVMPAFIDIGQSIEDAGGEKEELKAFHQAGFLGNEYGPFILPQAAQAQGAVRPPEGMTVDRFVNRYKQFQKLVQSATGPHAHSDHQESMLRSMDNAYRLLNSEERKAFDLSLESKEDYARYNTGNFGLGCLLARRLTESGARFIEVTTGYGPFKKWDTHENGHETVKMMKKEVDAPIAQLVLDLEARGLLDRTLVVVASEFSRDMLTEGVPGSTARDQSRAKSDVLKEMKHYGQHRHFTGGSSVLLFGGGVKQGHLYGGTAEERPYLATGQPVSVSDLHATIYHAMGISPKTEFTIEQRPFFITQDGLGKPVMDIFQRG